MFEWEAALFLALESNGSGRENIYCLWASLWYDDGGNFFMELFFFHDGCLGRVIDLKMEVGVVQVVVWVV